MIMKISLIITVLNEEKNIELLLNSIAKQSQKPDEVIITDAGSSDATVQVIKNWRRKNSSLKSRKLKLRALRVLKKIGNRSVGRNFAIKKSKFSWIAITDAGCILHRNWLRELVRAQIKNKADVIAGYYEGRSKTLFQEAVIPYFLVMPERVKVDSFLPATRSMMIRKSVWKTAGGFNEQLSHNEDYDFARWIKKHKNRFKISFTKKAVVSWLPPDSLSRFVRTIYRFAQGDVEAGIVRPKVVSVFARYLLFLLIKIFTPFLASLTLIIYLVWSIFKNWYYVPRGWYWLPLLQVSSDIAVMWGSVRGVVERR